MIFFLDLLKMLGTSKKYSPKWWFKGDLPWYKVKNDLKQIQLVGGFNPLKNMSLNWIISPGIGVKFQKCLSCHHIVMFFYIILR